MADTFFGFDTSLNNGDHLLSPDDLDCGDNEEEYDALNDETFGALEDSSSLDDWEQQHEQFAEIAESSKHSDQIENSISKLVSDRSYDPLSADLGIWTYCPNNEKFDIFNDSSILSSLQKASKSFIERNVDSLSNSKTEITRSLVNNPNLSPYLNHSEIPQHNKQSSIPPNKICTVEELEKNLLRTSTKSPQITNQKPNVLSNQHVPPSNQHHPLQNQQQRPVLPPGLQSHQPPGFHSLFQPIPLHQQNRPRGRGNMGQMVPPPLRHVPLVPPPHHNMPPGLMNMIPHHPPHPFLSGRPPPGPPGLMFPGNGQFPVNHPFNFPPPMHNVNQNRGNNPPHPLQHLNSNNSNQHNHQQQQNQQHMRSNNRSNNNNMDNNHHYHHHQQQHHQNQQYHSNKLDSQNSDSPVNRDEYAGLMTNREKQWLLNIQLLQLNTGTPYFDDYYYTVFKERKSKINKENLPNERNIRFLNNNNNRQRRNSDRQENNTLTPRVYTPLQFENSLGKIQCGSVAAPRKIIDMDLVTPEKDSDNHTSRDTRKTKQLLLELEALYTLLLKAEDITNPMAISNMEKLREIKQKQRLRELELAPTPEQKQEVLKLFKLESEPVVENQQDYIVKIVSGFLQDDKFTSFLNIRKGKMLLLRLLPHLVMDLYSAQLLEIWTKVLHSMAVVGRRDTAGDNILPKLYPFFKRYIQSSTMSDVLDIVSGLVEAVKLENSRSTPLSHQGRTPLHFVLLNKFGISALATLFIRSELLISTDSATEKQQNDWSNFVISWAETVSNVSKVATPLEPIPQQIFNKHTNRIANLSNEKKKLLEKHFVDSD